jgi:hypothetical protein
MTEFLRDEDRFSLVINGMPASGTWSVARLLSGDSLLDGRFLVERIPPYPQY